MAVEQFTTPPITRIAAADLSASQFRLVKVSGAEGCVLCDANTDVVLGVVQNKPGSGKAATVAQHGKTKCIAGGTIAAGDALMSDAQGRCVTKSSTNPIFGYADEAGVVGQVISVLIP